MKYDIYKIILVLAIAALIGFVFGYFLEVVLVGAIALIIWQVYSLNQLHLWIRYPNKHPLPETSGQVYLLHRELNRTIQSNRTRKRQVASYLSQFRRAAAVLPDAIILIDPNGSIKWANLNAEKLLGIRWPQDSDVRFTDLVRDPTLNLILSPAPQPTEKTPKSIEFSSPLNRNKTLNIKAVAYSDDLRMILARDVSRLVKVNKMHTDFVANVSHELKTPLTVLRGYLEILVEKTKSFDDATVVDNYLKPLEQMSLQSGRMQLIVNDLLYLSKLEDSEYKQTQHDVIVAVLVTSLLESLEAKIDKKKLKIEHRLEPNLAIHGNQNELYSALSNLISNAVNYTPARGRIKITTAINFDGSALIKIKDDGIGIPDSKIPRLTERFYRVDDDRSREGGGTGLGLAIVKHVLQRHDATLEIDSKLGSGSTFTCVFPAQRVIKLESLHSQSSLLAQK